jgi:hypothetical protein
MRQTIMLAVVALVGLTVACTGGDDHTGFACSGGTVTFSSDDCQRRITEASCKDGGTELRGDGGTQLCCVFTSCSKSPFPEYD